MRMKAALTRKMSLHLQWIYFSALDKASYEPTGGCGLELLARDVCSEVIDTIFNFLQGDCC
jgi:hypothetical protein